MKKDLISCPHEGICTSYGDDKCGICFNNRIAQRDYFEAVPPRVVKYLTPIKEGIEVNETTTR